MDMQDGLQKNQIQKIVDIPILSPLTFTTLQKIRASLSQENAVSEKPQRGQTDTLIFFSLFISWCASYYFFLYSRNLLVTVLLLSIL